ncbi:MAG: BlaI/MecI/CopY family transcriptional regulator [Pirellulaceae bacterium]|nr:BlaI/MecI/CopY family transcriptional regulator [Pirellulaceae bacterium]
MAKKKVGASDLGRRERQILEVIFKLGEASVGDVLEQLPDPPAYDSVRTMLRMLEAKGLLRHRCEGTKYVYRPTQSHETASRSALSHLMKTFFKGSASDTVAAVFDLSSDNLSHDELDQLEKLIEQARKEGR